MDYRAVFQIAAAGMDLEKRRVDVAALNLANMHSSVPAGQAPYAAQRVVAQPLQANFSRALGLAEPAVLPRDVQVVATDAAPRLVHEPGHPHADAQGFVSYAAIDQATEMVTVNTALRAYEANVAVASTARAMAAKALEIGGQG
ncbi:MAG TPA: flagellar basal body rod C-terminal domain-containing protein [Roseateles sp.]